MIVPTLPDRPTAFMIIMKRIEISFIFFHFSHHQSGWRITAEQAIMVELNISQKLFANSHRTALTTHKFT